MFKKDTKEPKKVRNEKRQHPRVNKHFILTYTRIDQPQKKQEITQLKNISRGGMCFSASEVINPSTPLRIELKTPYLTKAAFLEGTVIGSTEKIKGIVYEVRLQFANLNPDAEEMLNKLIEFFIQETDNGTQSN